MCNQDISKNKPKKRTNKVKTKERRIEEFMHPSVVKYWKKQDKETAKLKAAHVVLSRTEVNRIFKYLIEVAHYLPDSLTNTAKHQQKVSQILVSLREF